MTYSQYELFGSVAREVLPDWSWNEVLLSTSECFSLTSGWKDTATYGCVPEREFEVFLEIQCGQEHKARETDKVEGLRGRRPIHERTVLPGWRFWHDSQQRDIG